MPRKTYSKTGRACRVTFVWPGDVAAQTVALCGEFNDWDPTAHPMTRRKDGSFSVTLTLPAGHTAIGTSWIVPGGPMTWLQMAQCPTLSAMRILSSMSERSRR